MKKVISILLSVVMLLSVFSVLGVVASAASPSDVMYVKSSGFSNGKITYDIYLKKNISLIGTIVKAVYDPNVLKPVSGGAHASSASANGIFVADKVSGVNNAYSMAFVSMDSYSVGSSDKAFMTVTFELASSAASVAEISFYCVEFNTTDTNKKIEKNDANPPLIQTLKANSLNVTTYVGVYSTATGLRVEWKATPGATGYEVFKYDSSKKSYVSLGKTNALYYDDNKVPAGGSGSYIVRSYNANGYDSGASVGQVGYFVKATDKLSISMHNTGVKLAWNAVAGATGYRVYRRVINADNSRSGWTYLGTATTTSYIDKSALTNQARYEYTVRSATKNGLSVNSVYANIRYYAAPTPVLSAVVGGVQIKWNAVAGAQRYNVYRRYNGSNTWVYLKTVDANTLSYKDTAAVSGRNIIYAVRALGAEGNSPIIEKKIAYVGIPHITSAASGVNGVTIKWGAIQNASGYRVYRRAAGAKSWTYLGTVKNTYYTDKNVTSGVYYKYTVRTVFYKLFSGYESGRLIRYIAAPKLTSIKNTGSGVIVNWNTVAGGNEYRVYRRAAGKPWQYLATTTSTQFVDRNAGSGYYRYTVRAVAGKNGKGWYSGYQSGLLIKR